MLTFAWRRSVGAAVMAALLGVPALAAGVITTLPAHAATTLVPVLIRHDPAGGSAAEAAVVRAGGVIDRRLPAVDTLAGDVPAAALPVLLSAPGVLAVTPDRPVRLANSTWLADEDTGSLYNLTKYAGAHDAWSKSDATGRKVTGKGIGVALIDSGVAPVKGLAEPAKVINGPDLSFESQAPNLRHLDTYGHGTHMAGIIAGRDPEVSPGNENDSTHFVGVAPDAHLINMKVASADGAVDVSQVIAAIDWVVTHRNDPGLNIRVLNLSFGTDSLQDPRLDPLSHAVEAAWRNGIVVVVAVGNDGEGTNRMSMPARNPYVIAVGAADPMGTDDRADDTVAAFSTRGSWYTRRPDLVAAGKSVVSLRNPNSYVDTTYPGGLVAGDPAQRLFRGSGTSQSTAAVSGAVALLLQHRPNLTPDQVKRLLMANAQAMPKADSIGRGAGQLDIKRAVEAAAPWYVQLHLPSTGTGSLDQARGTARVADPETGVELTGEIDIMGHAWTASTWARACSSGTAWTGGTWNGSEWAGTDWTGTSWSSRTWSSRTWSGTNWSGQAWSSRTWSDATWTGAGWSSRTWSSRTWSSRTWSSRTWSGRTWGDGYWSSQIWS